MPTRYIATVHIMLKAESETEAWDAFSGLLTECGIYNPETGVVDWCYTRPADPRGGVSPTAPRAYAVPDEWDRDKDSLAGFLAANKPLQPISVWQQQVVIGATRLGYDDWLRTYPT